jgi:hypothetical protein
MATKEQIRAAADKAGEALRELEALVNEGIPGDMWEFGKSEDEDFDNFVEAHDIATLLFPFYVDGEYMEIDVYAEGLINQVDN